MNEKRANENLKPSVCLCNDIFNRGYSLNYIRQFESRLPKVPVMGARHLLCF